MAQRSIGQRLAALDNWVMGPPRPTERHWRRPTKTRLATAAAFWVSFVVLEHTVSSKAVGFVLLGYVLIVIPIVFYVERRRRLRRQLPLPQTGGRDGTR